MKVASSSRIRLRSGDLARVAGVSADTLRHYERIGVLAKPHRAASGYREYASEAVDRVKVIRRALTMGFSLKELARVFQVRERGGAPCREVRAMTAEKLAALDGRIAELVALRDHMTKMLGQWDRKLAGTPGGARAYLLDSLANAPSPNSGEKYEDNHSIGDSRRLPRRVRAVRRAS
jgi:DNA-binding transcriptional MerR regulator